MAVRRKEFARMMEEEPRGRSLQAQMRRAQAAGLPPDRFDKPSAIDRVILAILRARKKKRTAKMKGK